MKAVGQGKMAFRGTRSRAKEPVSRVQGEGTEVQGERESLEGSRPAVASCQAFIQGSQTRDLPRECSHSQLEGDSTDTLHLSPPLA